ncbi:MAG TPA: NAD(P)-dependent alcohol dehydrogenase [bacterium]|jgi:NADPH:quinone reductase-like Zn-dependent oxidoreductase|nr:NAD(P)-dependent alcohol dehydrogenase [bacterium]
MKAITIDRYGPPECLKLADLPKPEPKEREVLVRVRAGSVNAADWHVMRADPFLVRLAFGLLRPKFKVPGADLAGQVEAVGAAVTRFKVGDEVFGCLSACGWGAFAEYACAPEEALALKPARLSFEQAAAVPLAGMTAVQAVRGFGRVQAGQKVLVNGASGGVGTFAVQVAKALGAEVTAVCSARNLEMARSMGADHVIDYQATDFTRQEARYDLIVAANGYHPISAYKGALGPTGRYAMVGGSGKQMTEVLVQGAWLSKGGQKLGNVLMKPDPKDLDFLRGLMEEGKLIPVVDRSYTLEQVPEAIRYLEEGHARGKVVITV